jgi:hypothetical protein
VREGHAALAMKQEITALFGAEICWKWRFGILLGFENNTKTDKLVFITNLMHNSFIL